MKWIGGDHCRIESVKTVQRVNLKKRYTNNFTPDRGVHCFCFKLSGVSLHREGTDSVLCEANTLLYIPNRLDYFVDVVEEGPSIAVDFDLTPESVYEPRLKLLRVTDPLAVRRLFEEMLALSVGVHAGDSYALLGRMYQLMGMIEDQLSGQTSGGGFAKIEPALIYIRDHLSSQTLTESMLAERCGYSIGYFRRVFTAAIGMSPMQYIIDRRMKRAASMLRSGYFTLAEVAAEAGFANVYYFSTAFKRHFGVPPGKWREHSL
jgi:AraC-like DNA-binding protein